MQELKIATVAELKVDDEIYAIREVPVYPPFTVVAVHPDRGFAQLHNGEYGEKVFQDSFVGPLYVRRSEFS